MSAAHDLAHEFPVAGGNWETGPGDLPFLVVETEDCRARLTPYGGQLCEWTPAGQRHPVLFLSPRSAFARGKAIRGGVPVCFPWFGNHPGGDPSRPAHGFARTRMWDVAGVARDAAGDVRVDLRMAADDATRAQWPAEFEAQLTLSLGRTLAMTFDAVNRGVDDLTYEIALHSYFTVGDVEQTRVHGLEHTRFVDKVDGMKEYVQGGAPLAFTGETDRVFLDTGATCTIDDPVLARRIRVAKHGSLATVVWNPGRAKGEAMADVSGDAWRGFVCVETAQCGVHAVRLAPGARHAIVARVDVDLLTP